MTETDECYQEVTNTAYRNFNYLCDLRCWPLLVVDTGCCLQNTCIDSCSVYFHKQFYQLTWAHAPVHLPLYTKPTQLPENQLKKSHLKKITFSVKITCFTNIAVFLYCINHCHFGQIKYWSTPSLKYFVCRFTTERLTCGFDYVLGLDEFVAYFSKL